MIITAGRTLITAERHRQITVEGWTPEHDDQHGADELGRAGHAYAWHARTILATGRVCKSAPPSWPWEAQWWKPTASPVRNWVKAGALYEAQAERCGRWQKFLDMAEAQKQRDAIAGFIDAHLATLPALSIRQPWAWLILNAGKDVENRDWPEWYPARSHRGEFLIHAAKGCTRQEYYDARAFAEDIHFPSFLELPALSEIPRGGIVGMARAVDFVETDASPWFVGPGALTLADVQSLPFHACPGSLGFFKLAA